MKRQFLQIENIRANASKIEAFSFLLLHLDFGFDSRTQVRHARRNTRQGSRKCFCKKLFGRRRASQILRTF